MHAYSTCMLHVGDAPVQSAKSWCFLSRCHRDSAWESASATQRQVCCANKTAQGPFQHSKQPYDYASLYSMRSSLAAHQYVEHIVNGDLPVHRACTASSTGEEMVWQQEHCSMTLQCPCMCSTVACCRWVSGVSLPTAGGAVPFTSCAPNAQPAALVRRWFGSRSTAA